MGTDDRIHIHVRETVDTEKVGDSPACGEDGMAVSAQRALIMYDQGHRKFCQPCAQLCGVEVG